jgi:hypothetical protein
MIVLAQPRARAKVGGAVLMLADHKVDALDFNALILNWQQTGRTWAEGDFNGDHIVDALDFNSLILESNIRSASVVGMVGAGGIGVILYEVIRGFEYAQTSAVILIIIVFVTSIDLASARIRKLFI